VGYSIEYLAREFTINKRTVYRDLDVLRKAGIPVAYDAARRGYIVSPPFDIKLSSISEDQLAAAMLAAHIFSFSCAEELSQLIRQAISKLLAQTPTALREEVAHLLSSVVRTAPASLPSRDLQQMIHEILTAIRRRRPIRIVYNSGGETVRLIKTKVTPQRLAVSQENWYLIGRSSWHRKQYRFNLLHIRQAEQIEEDGSKPLRAVS
jgi:predicted DNA-binding transcriptional regulator YafY